jgi:peroxiredoxin
VNAYQPKGLKVLAVNAWGEPLPTIQEWQNTHHLPAEILVDPPQAVFALYGGNGTPTSFFIDRHGRVVYSDAGPESYADFADKISKLL